MGVFPESTSSHFSIIEPILKGLARKGHNVTVVGCFPLQQKIKNYIDITIDNCNVFPSYIQKFHLDNLKLFGNLNRFQLYLGSTVVNSIGLDVCKTLMESKDVQEIIFKKNNRTFDILLTEEFNSNCGAALAKKFHCPVVRIHTVPIMPWSYERFGIPLNPAYMPNHFLKIAHSWSFLARLENSILTMANIIYYKTKIQMEKDLFYSYTGDASYYDDHADSLMLVNTHYSLNPPIPLVPNVIEIGGIHIKAKTPLPKVS